MQYFYHPNPESDLKLSSEESFHCVKVLRKNQFDEIDIIDGKGSVYTCRLESVSHRVCEFSILTKKTVSNPKPFYTHIAIAPTKNQDRLEWFVEKSCELGVDEISFIYTKRTERKKINLNRIEKKAVSAMKQSKNLFKTIINELISFEDFFQNQISIDQKFIAYVDVNNDIQLSSVVNKNQSCLVMIGPEGDFTANEVLLAQKNVFQKVALGQSVLRTETAGIIACHSINLINEL